MEDYYRLSFKYAKILTDLKEILQNLEPEEEQEEEVSSNSTREHLNKLSRTSHSRMNLRIPSPTPDAKKRFWTRRRNRYRYPCCPIS